MARSTEPPQTPQAPHRRGAMEDDTVERERRRSTMRNKRASLAAVAQGTIERSSTPRRAVSGEFETPTRGSQSPVRLDFQRPQQRQVSNSRRQSGRFSASAADIDQWMKMLRGNRINAENTWSFGIIDYFHDLVKEGNTVNFQKASLTLDGCVKVYTSRVDSAVAQTTKLLSGLITSEPVDIDEDEAISDGKPKKRKARVRTSTCVSKPEAQELDVEKLRRLAGIRGATTSDFDEGGAKGTRLWSELTDCRGWVGGTRKKTDFDEAESQSQASESAEPAEADNKIFDGAFVDMAYQRARFFSSMEGKRVHPSAAAVDLAVADPQASTNALIQNLHDWDLNGNDEAEDFGGDLGGDLDYDRLEEAFSDVGADMSLSHAADESFAQANASDGTHGVVNWDVMASFDDNKSQSWAGRDHWRLRQYQRIKDGLKSTNYDKPAADGASSATPTRKKKLLIDFAEEGPSPADVFKPPTTLKLLNKPEKQTTKYTHTLPLDLSYRSRRQLALFLPPGNRVGPAFRRVRHARPVTASAISGDQPGDQTETDQVEFWAQANEDAPQQHEADFYGGDNEQDFGAGADDENENDGGDFGRPADDDFDAPPYLDALPQSRSRGIGFARAARNVDVHQLKNNMWNIMTTEAAAQPADAPLSLAHVMEDTASGYRPEKRSELSTPFYFICLLHLANEQGLELHNTPDLDDLAILNTRHT